MEVDELPGSVDREPGQRAIQERLIGLRGRLACPFWGWMASWAALCGALASNRLRWQGDALLALVLVLLLVELAWGSLWELAVGAEWWRPLAERWPLALPASRAYLPYTQPGSPAGRLGRQAARLLAWWRGAFWPASGPALLGLLAAGALTAVLGLLLPGRLRPLQAAFVALLGLGLAWQRRGRSPLLGQALVRVGLGWLAGHAALAEVQHSSLVAALACVLAAWGALRMAAGRRGGWWLLNAGQALGVGLLVVLKQPLAAGAAGLLLFGQVAVLLPSLGAGAAERAALVGRVWPWLMMAMLVLALALP